MAGWDERLADDDRIGWADPDWDGWRAREDRDPDRSGPDHHGDDREVIRRPAAESPRSVRNGPGGRRRFDRLVSRWLPAPVAARLDPGRAGAVGLVLVVVVAAVVAAIGVWAARPEVQPVAGLPAVSAGPGGSGGTAAAAPSGTVPGGPAPPAAPGSPVVVSVVGKVARPGLVRVTDGARVADAVDAAGGALPGVDMSVLNLARRVGDGEQIAVGVPPAADAAPGAGPASGREPGAAPGEPLPASGSASGGSGSGSGSGSGTGGAAPGGKVDLNRATAADLDALPGVGPVTASKILDWRAKNGRFTRIEQLREVDGIGERRYAQLSALVSV